MHQIMKYTLAVSCCSAGAALANCALLKGFDRVHAPAYMAYDRSHTDWTSNSTEFSERIAHQPRFAVQNDATSEAPSIDSGEKVPPPNGNTVDTGATWVEPPQPEYMYPCDDYLVIPNTRRYCEGGNILLATAAKSVRES